MAIELKFADKASREMLKKASEENIQTVWHRYEAMQPQCGFGTLGICCKICSMGPCRIDPFGKGPKVGICGASADTIAARNLARMIAAGTAAHGDHGRSVANTLLGVAEGHCGDYSIKDSEKLKAIAAVYSINTAGKGEKEIALAVAQAAIHEYSRQDGEMIMPSRAPKKRQEIWRSLGIYPRGIDREVVEMMNRTTMGVDAEYHNIIKQGMRTSLANGWGGSMIATELSDVLFGSPQPVRSRANLGVLQKENVNVVVHGHEPILSDILAVVSQDPEIVAMAQAKGASGITVAGICCTANEILMRHGIPIAGSFMQQELAIITGIVECMIVDVQCLMPGLASVAGCFHTKLITTSPMAKIPGATHVEFHEEQALATAKQLLRMAIDNFSNRQIAKIKTVPDTTNLVAGFTAESVFEFLGGKFRSTYRPLNDAIMTGRLRGAAAIVGCSNPNTEYEESYIKMVAELLRNDVLIVSTGCAAITFGKHGLLRPETAFEVAGKGLQEVCNAVGIPPVLHMGACVDNTRILNVLTNMVAEGGLGDDISDLPIAASAPEWMSEKAVSIGFYAVASGVYTMIGKPLPVEGSVALHRYLTEEIEAEVGGKWAFEEDPIEAAHKMIRHIDKKRAALKLKPMIYEQAFKPGE